MRDPRWPVAMGLAAAILSPVSELATGSDVPYLLVLIALIALIWPVWRLSRRELGLVIGEPVHYLRAAVYPFVAMAPLVVLSFVAGAWDLSGYSAAEMFRKLGLMFAATLPGVLITEEGFFRGALWGLSRRKGMSDLWTLGWTTLMFTGWHIAVPIIEEPFRLPVWQMPIYFVNATLLGLAWGLLRLVSGSVYVPCVAHAVWNALAYVLFGYGPKAGALGIEATGIYGPERGVIGILLNTAVVVWLWRLHRRVA